MTHTNHRRGSVESLKTDFVILAMIDPQVKAQHTYRGSLRKRIRRFLEICARHNPIALVARTPSGERLRYLKGWKPEMNSGIHRVSKIDEITRCEELADEGIGHAVFTSRKAVEEVLRELKEADLGLSIVVSGIFDEVFDICKEIGLKPHTVNMSLGTWGNTGLLPEDQTLQICTMCGHAMISPRLVRFQIERVRRGVVTSEEAAVELGKQCTCNIFNIVRAVEIINKMVKK